MGQLWYSRTAPDEEPEEDETSAATEEEEDEESDDGAEEDSTSSENEEDDAEEEGEEEGGGESEGESEPHVLSSMLCEDRLITVAAPMVRFSSIASRVLYRHWGADITFTQMMVAEDFVNLKDTEAHNINEVDNLDRPCVAQFAANDPEMFATAAEQVALNCDAIDLNCGCPQDWVISSGLGSALLKKPQKIYDIMTTATRRLPEQEFSIKIRINKDLKKTVEIAKRAEHCGLSFITVHGRTPEDSPYDRANHAAIRLINENVSIPIIANGGATSLNQVKYIRKCTGCSGVMVGHSLIHNPALFHGYSIAPPECIVDFLTLTKKYQSSFGRIQRPLCEMAEPRLSTKDLEALKRSTNQGEIYKILNRNHPELLPAPLRKKGTPRRNKK
ncbi:tRNA-dihydrouridine synthase [Pelomyxa schiedti]|nr:tRNA-dihydrouridine synthase [Pelomyxa schiedti]